MRIKRWKELLTGIALVGAITPAISISVNKKNTSQVINNLSVLNSTSSKTIVDYSLVEKIMSEVSSKSLNNQNNVELTSEQEQKVQELQQHYLDLFQTNNYSLEEIQSYMCENFPQYKEEYEKQINIINDSYKEKKKNIFLIKNSLDIDKLKGKIKELEVQRGILIGLCSGLSAAAAGFYAAAFWTFGATIPFAIACTTGSVQTGITQSNILDSINKLNSVVINSQVFPPKDFNNFIADICKGLQTVAVALHLIGAILIALVEPTTLTKQAGVACEIVAAIIDFYCIIFERHIILYVILFLSIYNFCVLLFDSTF